MVQEVSLTSLASLADSSQQWNASSCRNGRWKRYGMPSRILPVHQQVVWTRSILRSSIATVPPKSTKIPCKYWSVYHWTRRVVWNYKMAWHLKLSSFRPLRKACVKVAIVSNFDTRLRPLLRALKCDHWFDAVPVSAEVEARET